MPKLPDHNPQLRYQTRHSVFARAPSEDAITLCPQCGNFVPGRGEVTSDAGLMHAYCKTCYDRFVAARERVEQWDQMEKRRLGMLWERACGVTG